jgi:exosortase/archaeosortase
MLRTSASEFLGESMSQVADGAILKSVFELLIVLDVLADTSSLKAPTWAKTSGPVTTARTSMALMFGLLVTAMDSPVSRVLTVRTSQVRLFYDHNRTHGYFS